MTQPLLTAEPATTCTAHVVQNSGMGRAYSE
jgi:hypothetical protein